jgi:hypothetical protein
VTALCPSRWCKSPDQAIAWRHAFVMLAKSWKTGKMCGLSQGASLPNFQLVQLITIL